MLNRRLNIQVDKHDLGRAKPIDTFVSTQAATGKWREEVVSADIAGTLRDIVIFRAARTTNRIKHDWHGSSSTFCPPKWFDLALGSGAGAGFRSKHRCED